jgi:hypothetical protein
MTIDEITELLPDDKDVTQQLVDWYTKFKIICIKTCVDDSTHFSGIKEIKKGEIFITNKNNFHFLSNCVRIFKNGELFGLFDNTNFVKLEEHRNNTIEEIFND